MVIGWISVIIAVILTTYALTKYFIEDKQKYEKEWGGTTSSGNNPIKSTEHLQGFYLAIYNRCAKYIHTYESDHNIGTLASYLPKIQKFLLKYNNKPDDGNVDQVALTILWNFTSDALKCGTYHFHIGSLTPEGREVLRFAEHCLDTALQKEYITQQDADEAMHALMQSIRDAG
ncbi:MAG: hypothetical protein IKA46_02690 [Clostridia bacterium]|nr:hypothetical protein [Clostridia bacterium]